MNQKPISVQISDDMLCLSCVRGIEVVRPYQLPFSFYFGAKQGNLHNIQIKYIFNSERIFLSKTSILNLCGNWSVDNDISSSDRDILLEFFRTYLILFILVWDEYMQDGTVQDYFEGRADLQDILDDIDFEDVEANLAVRKAKSIAQLEQICRDNNFVDMRGNWLNFMEET